MQSNPQSSFQEQFNSWKYGPGSGIRSDDPGFIWAIVAIIVVVAAGIALQNQWHRPGGWLPSCPAGGYSVADGQAFYGDMSPTAQIAAQHAATLSGSHTDIRALEQRIIAFNGGEAAHHGDWNVPCKR